MSITETPLIFDCHESRLIGLLTRPVERPIEIGLLILVGGPQYRAGSHRQFTLLARDLAGRGIASLRFDHRGIGDSEGETQPFDALEADIARAIDTLMMQVPELRGLVLWGLCDAASTALIHAYRDPRIAGLVLLNPWIDVATIEAQARLRHYYLKRLMQRSFWMKLLSGRMRWLASLRDLAGSVRSASSSHMTPSNETVSFESAQKHDDVARLMLEGLQRFSKPVRLILSGQDLTAAAFIRLIEQNRKWRRVMARGTIDRHEIPEANHTFSSQTWRNQVMALTADAILKLVESR